MLIDTSKLSVQFTVQGKTHTIEGFAENCWATEQLWHKLISVEDDVKSPFKFNTDQIKLEELQ